MSMTNIAQNLKFYRGLAGLTQEELAHRSGVTLASINRIERGQVNKPHKPTLLALCKALKVSLEVLKG